MPRASPCLPFSAPHRRSHPAASCTPPPARRSSRSTTSRRSWGARCSRRTSRTVRAVGLWDLTSVTHSRTAVVSLNNYKAGVRCSELNIARQRASFHWGFSSAVCRPGTSAITGRGITLIYKTVLEFCAKNRPVVSAGRHFCAYLRHVRTACGGNVSGKLRVLSSLLRAERWCPHHLRLSYVDRARATGRLENANLHVWTNVERVPADVRHG